MAQIQQQGQQQQVQIDADNETLKGKYSNNMMVSHSKEEFVMDFLLVHPPKGLLQSRVVTSPGHMKRIVAAIQDNLKKYEAAFGKIEEAKAPESGIGFKAS